MADAAALERAARTLARAATGRDVAIVAPLSGGYRNDMLRVRCDGAADVVVRLYRRANRAAVEAAVLARAGDAVAVPPVLLTDPDGRHTGRPALVLGYVDGVPARDVLASADTATVRAIGRLLGQTLAPLRAIRFAHPGWFTGPDLRPAPMSGATMDVVAWVDDALASPGGRSIDRRLAVSWRALVVDAAGMPAADADPVCLVHGDFNPKNILLRPSAGTWAVAAVLDWEFAFAGSALTDIGNLLRFAHRLPAGYVGAVRSGFGEAGGHLPPAWRRAAALMDVYALADFLRRGPDHAYFEATVDLLRAAVARGGLVLSQ